MDEILSDYADILLKKLTRPPCGKKTPPMTMYDREEAHRILCEDLRFMLDNVKPVNIITPLKIKEVVKPPTPSSN